MRKYFVFAWASYLNMIEYRVNFLWEIFGSLINMLMLYAFWVAILGSGFINSSYTNTSIGLYYLFITFIGTISVANYSRISNMINSGGLSMEIIKPYNFFLKELVQFIPHKILQSLTFSLILVLIFSLGVAKYPEIHNTILFVISVVITILSKFYIALCLGGLGFWFKRVHGFGSLFWNIGGLFSGELIPVDLLPHTLFLVSAYLPFRYLAFFPVEIILEKVNQQELVLGFATQTLWLIMFMVITKLIWKKGLFKYDSSGN